MRKSTIRHEHLKEVIYELKSAEKMEEVPEETFIRLFAELKHSCLLIAGEMVGDEIRMLIIVFHQRIDMLATAIEISGFFRFFDRTAAFRAKVLFADLGFGPEAFFVDAIPAFIRRKVDVVLL